MPKSNLDSPFLRFWFTGWQHGLEELDKSSRSTILKQCAKACAQSFTVKIFQDARSGGADLKSFTKSLQRLVPHATYEKLSDNEILVTYSRCGCDLVASGLVNSPLLCECSAHNLQENLEQSLGQSVEVQILGTILRGDQQCVLLARIDPS